MKLIKNKYKRKRQISIIILEFIQGVTRFFFLIFWKSRNLCDRIQDVTGRPLINDSYSRLLRLTPRGIHQSLIFQ